MPMPMHVSELRIRHAQAYAMHKLTSCSLLPPLHQQISKLFYIYIRPFPLRWLIGTYPTWLNVVALVCFQSGFATSFVILLYPA
jgi:hypothetical protein